MSFASSSASCFIYRNFSMLVFFLCFLFLRHTHAIIIVVVVSCQVFLICLLSFYERIRFRLFFFSLSLVRIFSYICFYLPRRWLDASTFFFYCWFDFGLRIVIRMHPQLNSQSIFSNIVVLWRTRIHIDIIETARMAEPRIKRYNKKKT